MPLVTIIQSTGRARLTAGHDSSHATIDGRDFCARSKHGSLFALCRQLVAAGIPDQPYETRNAAFPETVALRGPSIHAAAGLTIEQRDGYAPRFKQWEPRSGNAPHSARGASPMRAEPPDARR